MSGVAKQNNIRDIFEHFSQNLPDGFAVATSGGISSAALLASAVAVNKKPVVLDSFFNCQSKSKKSMPKQKKLNNVQKYYN